MKWVVGLLDLLALLWVIIAGMFAWFSGAVWGGSIISGTFIAFIVTSPALAWLTYSMAAHYRSNPSPQRNVLAIALVLSIVVIGFWFIAPALIKF